MVRREGRVTIATLGFFWICSRSSRGTPATRSTAPEARAAKRVAGSVMIFSSTCFTLGAPAQ